MSNVRLILPLVVTAALFAGCRHSEPVAVPATVSGWKQHDITRTKPPVVEPVQQVLPAPVPADAVVMFNGKDLSQWQTGDGKPAPWKVGDGYFEVAPGTGSIRSKLNFGDVQLHVEWASPNPPKGESQDRGNSGIILMGKYEVQVLDSYRADTYADGQAAALYGAYPPIFNASRAPGEWQSYDIYFRRPRFAADGKLLEEARVTVVHNGVLVQNNEKLPGETLWLQVVPYKQHSDALPLELQDHGHQVRFRNFWIRPIPERPAVPAGFYAADRVIKMSKKDLQKYAGNYGGTPEHPFMTLTPQDDHLVVDLHWRPADIFARPVSDTEFVLDRTAGRLVFDRDASGNITGLTFKMGGADMKEKKL